MAKLEGFGFKSWALASAAFVASALPAAAQEAAQQFNIPPQSLASALNEFGRQSGRDILFSTEVAAGKQSPGVQGSYTPEAALRALLGGTGLEFRSTGARTFLVQASNASPTQLGATDAASSEADEEIVVTGTRIRGVTNDSSPTQVITREDIDRSGYSTTGELAESIPQNFGGLSSDGSLATGGRDIANLNAQYDAQSIDLRGLGPGSTLVLVNGQRRAGNIQGRVVDISTIPLALLDRVEIATGGRASIYGSDAVAGVVNLVVRRDFDGAATELEVGQDREGGTRFGANQVFGVSSDTYGFVLSYDYLEEDHFDVVDTGITTTGIGGRVPQVLYARPDAERHTGYAAGRLDLTPGLELYGDALFTRRESYSENMNTRPNRVQRNQQLPSTEQYNALIGARADLDEWEVRSELSQSRTETTIHSINSGSNFGVPFSFENRFNSSATLNTVSVTGDGPIGFVPGMRAAIGVEAREETIDSGSEVSRDVYSVFGELNVPIGPVELSLASRYDDYSDAGDTFNPQFGVTWKLNDAVSLRAAYSTAFRAPDLYPANLPYTAYIADLADPASSTGFTPFLVLDGTRPGQRPETAVTWSAGADARSSLGTFSLSYFEIDYTDRIELPVRDGLIEDALLQEAVYSSIINRMPDATINDLIANAFIFENFTATAFDPATQNALTVFPNVAIFDSRYTNLAEENVRGLDLSFEKEWDLGGDQWRLSASASYTFDHTFQLTPDAASASAINGPGKPVDLRIRAGVGYSNALFDLNAFANYTDGYPNSLSSTAGDIDSWTTVDLSLGVKLGFLNDALDRSRLTLNITNAFDEAPPRFADARSGAGYDAANANPFGRALSLRLSHRW